MYLPTIHQASTQLKEALSNIYEIEEVKAIASIVLESVLQKNRLLLQVDRNQTLTVEQFEKLNDITARLLQKEPVQYVLGKADFYGLQLKVNPSVLIPRQETEELVHWMVESVPKNSDELHILDIGVGSGCISLALKKEFPNTDITGIDVSREALAVAQENADFLQLPIQLQSLDVLDRTLWGLLPKFDIIVSNPPYICENEKELLDENVVAHEPSLALFVKDSDPLLFYKTIADLAQLKLHQNGQLFFEVSAHFGDDCRKMLINKNFQARLRKDINGKARMIQAVFPSI